MANPIAVANKRAIAEQRLIRATQAASAKFNVSFVRGSTPANRHPALAGAELVESVADFIEQITAASAAPTKGK